jgi:hypothetical protein
MCWFLDAGNDENETVRTPGDTIRFWLELEGPGSDSTSHCFATGGVVDFLEGVSEAVLLRGTVKALGQMKIFRDASGIFRNDERGVSYHAAWRVTEVSVA